AIREVDGVGGGCGRGLAGGECDPLRVRRVQDFEHLLGVGGLRREVRDQAGFAVERIIHGADAVAEDAAGDGEAGGDDPGGEGGPFAAARGRNGGHFVSDIWHFYWSRDACGGCEVFFAAFAHARLQAVERTGGRGLLVGGEGEQREIALDAGELLLRPRVIAQRGGNHGHLFGRKGLDRVEREVLSREGSRIGAGLVHAGNAF